MDDIHVIKALDNIESKLTGVSDGDILTVTIPEDVPAPMVENAVRYLRGIIADELRQHTGKKFGVLILTGGITAEMIRKVTEREYYRLAKAQVDMQTELNELKQTIAKYVHPHLKK